jgi:hypothetical protein
MTGTEKQLELVTEDESRATQVVEWLQTRAFEGIGPLSSATELAEEYRIDQDYPNNDVRVRALIRWETAKNFTSGFLTGLGGLMTLPIAVPAALGASWLILARMVAAIAAIYGHDLREDRVRTMVLLAIVGDGVNEVLKRSGIQVGRKITEKTISQISGKALIEINKRVGFRLITKAGERGVVNLMKAVPVAGGVVGGGFDAVTCRNVGRVAMKLFRPTPAGRS